MGGGGGGGEVYMHFINGCSLYCNQVLQSDWSMRGYLILYSDRVNCIYMWDRFRKMGPSAYIIKLQYTQKM